MNDSERTVRRVLLVTPYPWSTPHPVNDHVAELADGLVALRDAGDESAPEPVVLAPSADVRMRRSSRRVWRELARRTPPDAVLGTGDLVDSDLAATAPGERRSEYGSRDWPLLTVPVLTGPVSVAVRAALRSLLEQADIDLLHVHDPLAADVTRFLVRTWDGLTVATYHDMPAVTPLTAIAPPLRERVIDNVDRWLVSDPTAISQLRETTGVDKLDAHCVPNVAVSRTRTGAGTPATPGRTILVGRGDEDDAAVRELVRELAPLLEERDDLVLTLVGRWATAHRPVVSRALRDRVLSVDAFTRERHDALLAGSGVFVATTHTHQRMRDEAQAAGVRVIATTDASGTLAAHIVDALQHGPNDLAVPTASELARPVVAEYHALASRVQVNITPRRADDRSCVIDLHMHTSHSWDCATEPEALLHCAKAAGLTAVAVTDHNEISGALACAELAGDYDIQVIVGEEVKTSQGEVIGLFLTERIEPGLSWHETIARIRQQDGLVYVPHPFDRLHTIPDVHLLRDTLDEIDAFETYNARLAFEQYNRDAERFARKYNLVEGAGSDSHVVQGLGTAAVYMPAWDDKESFLLALAQGEILRRPKSLLYLQGLKWVNDLTGRSKKLPPEAVGRG